MMINTNYRSSIEYQKALNFLKAGCKCGCSAKLPHEKFAKLRTQFKSLPKPTQDTFVMGQLFAMKKGDITTSSRFPKRQSSYHWDNETPICQKTYLNLLGVSRDYLGTIAHEVAHARLALRTHGNTGRPPQWKTKMNLNQETKETIKTFILNYAETHGLPDPGKTKRATNSVIFLPTEMTYKSVHRGFLANLSENDKLKPLKYETFLKFWHQLTPQIKFLNPRTDLCNTYHQFRNELHSCQDEKTKAQTKKKTDNRENGYILEKNIYQNDFPRNIQPSKILIS